VTVTRSQFRKKKKRSSGECGRTSTTNPTSHIDTYDANESSKSDLPAPTYTPQDPQCSGSGLRSMTEQLTENAGGDLFFDIGDLKT